MKRKKLEGRLTRLWVVVIHVTNQKRAIEFYRDVLEMEIVLRDEKFNWVELRPQCGSSNVALVEPNPTGDLKAYHDASARIGAYSGIIFGTDDLDTLYQKLKMKGVVFKIEPKMMDWGGRLAVFLDPDGNELQVVEELNSE